MEDRTWVEISKEALKHNVGVVRGLLNPKTKLMAVIKANAYGHGFIETGRLFVTYGVDWLAVFTLEDALSLRKAKIKAPILVLGIVTPKYFAMAVTHQICLTICNQEYLALIPPNLAVHIKVDTGLSRQGVTISDLPEFIQHIPKNIIVGGIYSHFADAENLYDKSFSLEQIALLKQARAIAIEAGYSNLLTHLVATDGLLMYPEAEFDMVRAGIMLYGVPPSKDFVSKFELLGLRPALSWKTRISQLKSVPKGATVGYGRTEKAPRGGRLAVLPIGYWDGYPWALASRGYVAIRGHRCKVMGRVSMNIIMVDVSSVPGAQIGDEAELIGMRIPALELAESAHTISYEIITRINPWIPRKYV
ncbi:MAG: alanine racemase [Patescibacteria group bacterium]